MRISDWSSDVCSSDLLADQLAHSGALADRRGRHRFVDDPPAEPEEEEQRDNQPADPEIGGVDSAERLRAHRLGHHHAFLDLDALQEQVRADERAEEGAEAVEGLAERSEEHTSELPSLNRT